MQTWQRIGINIVVVILAVGVGFYQIYVKPLLVKFGKSPLRIPQSIGSSSCRAIPELQACHKIVLHERTGVLYLACSTQDSRTHWNPQYDFFDPSEETIKDYIATYDPQTSKITKWTQPDFNKGLGLSLFGMDVVPSSVNPNELFVYLVNHRVPITGQRPETIGADSVIEVFKTSSGGEMLQHVSTIKDPSVILTPNDVVGAPDGKSFYFVNDNSAKVGWTRKLPVLGVKSGSVGYCHLDKGCKFVAKKLHQPYGLASAPNGTLYVSNSIMGGVTILERQADNSVVVGDTIKTDYSLNHLSVDIYGHLWAAALPQTLTHCDHLLDPDVQSPSAVYRITVNTGINSYYGDKYKVERAFEDDGRLMSGITTVAFDARRRKLFMHGTAAPQLVVCNV